MRSPLQIIVRQGDHEKNNHRVDSIVFTYWIIVDDEVNEFDTITKIENIRRHFES